MQAISEAPAKPHGGCGGPRLFGPGFWRPLEALDACGGFGGPDWKALGGP